MNDIYIIKATLTDRFGNLKGNPSRTIAIGRNKTLYYFAEAIIKAFDFEFDHSFGFYDNLKNIYQSNIGFELFADVGEESDFPGVENARIKELFTELDQERLFVFDYGDNWMFRLSFIGIESRIKGGKYPIVIDKYLKAPKQYG